MTPTYAFDNHTAAVSMKWATSFAAGYHRYLTPGGCGQTSSAEISPQTGLILFARGGSAAVAKNVATFAYP